MLDQELTEEFSVEQDSGVMEKSIADIVGDGPGAPKVDNFAPEKDISYTREAILSRRQPYGDFLFNIPELGGKPALSTIASVYLTDIPDAVLAMNAEHIANGRGVRNEGLSQVLSIDQLRIYDKGLAWFTGPVLKDYLGVDVFCHGIKGEKIGMPREKLSDYLDDFKYAVPPI